MGPVRSSGLYQDNMCDSRMPQNAKCKVSSILGRLDLLEHNKKRFTTRQENSSKFSCSVRFLANTEKSQLQRTQHRRYIFDLKKGIVLPPPDRIQKIQLTVKHLDGRSNRIMHRN